MNLPVCAREKTHYVMVRKDLPAVDAAITVLHAAGETGPAPHGSVAVLLECANEDELRTIASTFPEAHLIVECDGEYAGQAMAFAIPPGEKRGALRRFPLWKGGADRAKLHGEIQKLRAEVESLRDDAPWWKRLMA